MNAPAPQLVSRQFPGDRSIGAILIDAGRLSLDNAERIIRLQRQEGLRFGDAGLNLGLLAPADIEFALARQFDYPYLVRGEGNVSEELVAAYAPFGEPVETLRALRSQLMLRHFSGDAGHRALAICSPGRGDGRSHLAANLAVVFSQLGERTLLIDADMRHPRQHQIFRLDNGCGLSSILSNRGTAEAIRRIPDFVALSVLNAGPMPPNPQELLGRPAFASLLADVAGRFDVILIDTPAADYADAQTIAARAGAALLVARKHQSPLAALGRMSQQMREFGIRQVGAVLSEF